MMKTTSAPPRPFTLTLGLAMLAVLGIVATNLIDLPASWTENRIVAVLQGIHVIAFPVLAVLWLRGTARWPWGVAGGLSIQALAGIIASRTVGLAGHEGDVTNWFEPVFLGVPASYTLMLVVSAIRLMMR